MYKRKRIKYEEISGEVMDCYYDDKCKKLNVELCKSEIGTPVLLFEDWTNDNTKKYFMLHLKEAIELKGIIDKAIVDWHSFELDLLQEEMDSLKEKNGDM